MARLTYLPEAEADSRASRCSLQRSKLSREGIGMEATCIELSPVSSTASPACNVWEIPSAEISRLPLLTLTLVRFASGSASARQVPGARIGKEAGGVSTSTALSAESSE